MASLVRAAPAITPWVPWVGGSVCVKSTFSTLAPLTYARVSPLRAHAIRWRTNARSQVTCSVEASVREKPSWIELPFHSVATGELTTVTWVTALPLTSTAEKTIGARSYGWSYGTLYLSTLDCATEGGPRYLDTQTHVKLEIRGLKAWRPHFKDGAPILEPAQHR